MKESAGILAFRNRGGVFEFFLVHPGGPFFVHKDRGWWSIPKGELLDNEEPLKAAVREFEEETGATITGTFLPLGTIKQKGGKIIHGWAVEFDLDPVTIVSNTFELQWPPKSGKMMSFPEIDKAAWFDLATAQQMINEKQAEFLWRAMASLV
ncbi:NUDIX domain-containing protein [Pedobacter sp. ASV28]|uniref:NUDIX domain-containing protein n=1 Tax=Pedobacter sp. ASV28 TaxID=2795123 RepID=UPI0018EBCD53|nr:NUDIX domain-containing protein [Pedobacter sp. ASV28]